MPAKPPVNGEYSEIRRALIKARKDHKLSQNDLGKVAGYCGATISTWEKGTRASVTGLIDWANSLGYRLTITEIEK